MTLNDETLRPPPAPRWLLRLFWASLAAAGVSLCFLLWAKWGLAVAMANDVWKYCF